MPPQSTALAAGRSSQGCEGRKRLLHPEVFEHWQGHCQCSDCTDLQSRPRSASLRCRGCSSIAAFSSLHINHAGCCSQCATHYLASMAQDVESQMGFRHRAVGWRQVAVCPDRLYSLHVEREEAFSKFAFHFCSIFLRVCHPLCIASMVASDAPAATRL